LSLKSGKFSKEALDEKKQKEAEAKKKAKKVAEKAKAKAEEEEEKKQLRESYFHTHQRVVLECSLVCSREDIKQRYNELPLRIRTTLFKKSKRWTRWCGRGVSNRWKREMGKQCERRRNSR
jgi:hypothetical protein